MALVTRELTSADIDAVDELVADIARWWDEAHRCDTVATFPPPERLRDALLDDSTTVAVVVETRTSTTVGLAMYRDVADGPPSTRILWLVARPASFAAVAKRLIAAAHKARPDRRLLGIVERTEHRARYLALPNVRVLAHADVADDDPVRRYPDGTCITLGA